MSWIPLHDTIFTDDWLCDLEEAERWAYVCFVLHSRNQSPRWKVKKCNTKHLSRVTDVTEVTICSMLKKAIEAGKISDDGEIWHVVNGKKYDLDVGAAERMRKHRAKKQDDTETLRYVTNVTVHDRTGQDITGQDTPEDTHSAKREEPNFDLVSKTVEEYNEHKPECWIKCTTPNLWIRQQIESQIPANRDEWDLPAILARLKAGFMADKIHGIDWLFNSDPTKGSRLNWKRILGGEFDHHSKSSNSGNNKQRRKAAGYLGAGGDSEAKF